MNYGFSTSKSWKSGEFMKSVLENNHEIAGITNFEIMKCGDPCSLLELYTVWGWEEQHVLYTQ